MNIDLTPVESSNVAAIGYDEASQTLAVQFRSGSTYHYQGVPASVNAQLWSPDAGSIGSFISKNVKPVYPGVRLDLPEENRDE